MAFCDVFFPNYIDDKEIQMWEAINSLDSCVLLDTFRGSAESSRN